MRMTSESRVAIPKKFWDEFAVSPGAEVEFVSDDGRRVLVKCSRKENFRHRERNVPLPLEPVVFDE